MSETNIRFRSKRANPAFLQKLDTLRLRLSPLISHTTGQAHPAFPRTLLSFYVLTEAQLDDLALYYHQRPPGHPLERCYPERMRWHEAGLSVADKRRKWGRFCGLRGCESPVGSRDVRIGLAETVEETELRVEERELRVEERELRWAIGHDSEDEIREGGEDDEDIERDEERRAQGEEERAEWRKRFWGT